MIANRKIVILLKIVQYFFLVTLDEKKQIQRRNRLNNTHFSHRAISF